jgi:hypothetical protein
MHDLTDRDDGPWAGVDLVGGGVMRRALAIAVVLMLVIPVLAAAQTASQRVRKGRVPSAQVQTTGSGAMTIIGRMVVNGTIPNRGSVAVWDMAGDARVHLAGKPLRFNSRGRISVSRASGILFVTGSGVQVQITGNGLSFSIAGNGRARFLGTGTYRLNSGEEQSWTPAWIRVAPSSSPGRRRIRECETCSSPAVPQR